MELYILSRPTISSCIYSIWLSVSVQQLCYFGIVAVSCGYDTCFAVQTCDGLYHLKTCAIPTADRNMRDPRTLGGFPLMSSRHRNLEPLGRWHATIYIYVSSLNISSILVLYCIVLFSSHLSFTIYKIQSTIILR